MSASMRIRQALVFAAGKGERMRPLTDHTPKPLLRVGAHRLIEWHLYRLAKAGIHDVVINVSHLAEQFELALGDGERYGLSIHYSHEGPEPLETGGGMLHALKLLRDAPFVLLNGDVWCDVELEPLLSLNDRAAHLLMVPRPEYAKHSDFHLDAAGMLRDDQPANATYSGIGVFQPSILQHWRTVVTPEPGIERLPPKFKLAPILRAAMREQRVFGDWLQGEWVDVGTPERLQQLNSRLQAIESDDA